MFTNINKYKSQIFYSFRCYKHFTMYILLYYIFSCLLNVFFFSVLHNNETEFFMLPYRVHTFFDITDTHTYVLIYLYLFPMFYASICHMAAICLLVILVFHICGKLSILSYRIKNIGMQDMVINRVRAFVRMHLELIW